MILRDAVHGDIEFNEDEVTIIDTPEVQRLRGIKQLGAASFVYPSATHTRFEHSLGTVFCTHKILNSLSSKYDLDPRLKKIIRISALLHDITHIPFGHTFEDERKLMPRHDKGNRFQLLTNNTVLGETLSKLKLKDEVSAIVENKNHPQIPKWAKQVVSSTIDADLLDYLKRDNYFTGLSQNYDERIFLSYMIKDDELGMNLVKKGLDRQDAITEIMNLLRLRYFLTERVYYHHTKVIVGSMISKALEFALAKGLTETDLLYQSDGSFLHFITKYSSESAALIQAVNNRNLFKRAYILTFQNAPSGIPERLIEQYASSITSRNQAEKKIADLAGISPTQVILYCSSLPSNKEAAVKVQSIAGWHPFNQVGTLKTYQEIAVLDTKFKNLWKLYILTPKEHLTKVAKASSEYFQLPNEIMLSEK